MGTSCGARRSAATADTCELSAGKTKSRISPDAWRLVGTRGTGTRDGWAGNLPTWAPFGGATWAPPGRRRTTHHDETSRNTERALCGPGHQGATRAPKDYHP